jgi:hypothetical protein
MGSFLGGSVTVCEESFEHQSQKNWCVKKALTNND